MSTDGALRRLVAQILLARADDLSASHVAAFLSGWSSALDLVRRTDLTLPSASPELQRAVATLVAAVESAATSVLDDED